MNVYDWHKEEFGVKPVVIGVHWKDESKLLDAIEESIYMSITYDEYRDLSGSDKELYDKGLLLF